MVGESISPTNNVTMQSLLATLLQGGTTAAYTAQNQYNDGYSYLTSLLRNQQNFRQTASQQASENQQKYESELARLDPILTQRVSEYESQHRGQSYPEQFAANLAANEQAKRDREAAIQTFRNDPEIKAIQSQGGQIPIWNPLIKSIIDRKYPNQSKYAEMPAYGVPMGNSDSNTDPWDPDTPLTQRMGQYGESYGVITDPGQKVLIFNRNKGIFEDNITSSLQGMKNANSKKEYDTYKQTFDDNLTKLKGLEKQDLNQTMYNDAPVRQGRGAIDNAIWQQGNMTNSDAAAGSFLSLDNMMKRIIAAGGKPTSEQVSDWKNAAVNVSTSMQAENYNRALEKYSNSGRTADDEAAFNATIASSGSNISDFFANWQAPTSPVLSSLSSSRAGYTPVNTLGDSGTQKLIEMGYSPQQALLKQYNDAASTPGTRDDQYYNNELQKSVQNIVEASSAYHHNALDSGLSANPNPYEFSGDLAAGILKGVNGSSGYQSATPVNLSMLNLPGGMGLQDAAWNAAVNNDKNANVKYVPSPADFTPAINRLTQVMSNGEMGPYGMLGKPTWTTAGGTQSGTLSLADQQIISYAGASHNPDWGVDLNKAANPPLAYLTDLGFGNKYVPLTLQKTQVSNGGMDFSGGSIVSPINSGAGQIKANVTPQVPGGLMLTAALTSAAVDKNSTSTTGGGLSLPDVGAMYAGFMNPSGSTQSKDVQNAPSLFKADANHPFVPAVIGGILSAPTMGLSTLFALPFQQQSIDKYHTSTVQTDESKNWVSKMDELSANNKAFDDIAKGRGYIIDKDGNYDVLKPEDTQWLKDMDTTNAEANRLSVIAKMSGLEKDNQGRIVLPDNEFGRNFDTSLKAIDVKYGQLETDAKNRGYTFNADGTISPYKPEDEKFINNVNANSQAMSDLVNKGISSGIITMGKDSEGRDVYQLNKDQITTPIGMDDSRVSALFAKGGFTGEAVDNFSTFVKYGTPLTGSSSAFGLPAGLNDEAATFSSGFLNTFREKPIEVAEVAIPSAIIGALSGGTGAAPTATVLGTGFTGSQIAGIGLGTLFVGQSGYKVYDAYNKGGKDAAVKQAGEEAAFGAAAIGGGIGGYKLRNVELPKINVYSSPNAKGVFYNQYGAVYGTNANTGVSRGIVGNFANKNTIIYDSNVGLGRVKPVKGGLEFTDLWRKAPQKEGNFRYYSGEGPFLPESTGYGFSPDSPIPTSPPPMSQGPLSVMVSPKYRWTTGSSTNARYSGNRVGFTNRQTPVSGPTTTLDLTLNRGRLVNNAIIPDVSSPGLPTDITTAKSVLQNYELNPYSGELQVKTTSTQTRAPTSGETMEPLGSVPVGIDVSLPGYTKTGTQVTTGLSSNPIGEWRSIGTNTMETMNIFNTVPSIETTGDIMMAADIVPAVESASFAAESPISIVDPYIKPTKVNKVTDKEIIKMPSDAVYNGRGWVAKGKGMKKTKGGYLPNEKLSTYENEIYLNGEKTTRKVRDNKKERIKDIEEEGNYEYTGHGFVNKAHIPYGQEKKLIESAIKYIKPETPNAISVLNAPEVLPSIGGEPMKMGKGEYTGHGWKDTEHIPFQKTKKIEKVAVKEAKKNTGLADIGGNYLNIVQPTAIPGSITSTQQVGNEVLGITKMMDASASRQAISDFVSSKNPLDIRKNRYRAPRSKGERSSSEPDEPGMSVVSLGSIGKSSPVPKSSAPSGSGGVLLTETSSVFDVTPVSQRVSSALDSLQFNRAPTRRTYQERGRGLSVKTEGELAQERSGLPARRVINENRSVSRRVVNEEKGVSERGKYDRALIRSSVSKGVVVTGGINKFALATASATMRGLIPDTTTRTMQKTEEETKVVPRTETTTKQKTDIITIQRTATVPYVGEYQTPRPVIPVIPPIGGKIPIKGIGGILPGGGSGGGGGRGGGYDIVVKNDLSGLNVASLKTKFIVGRGFAKATNMRNVNFVNTPVRRPRSTTPTISFNNIFEQNNKKKKKGLAF